MKTPAAGEFFPLGLFPAGDFGPFTLYTSKKHRVVRFARAPPKEPASYLQRRQRSAWTAAAAVWTCLPPLDKQYWSELARQNHLKISGHMLFMMVTTRNNREALQCLKPPTL